MIDDATNSYIVRYGTLRHLGEFTNRGPRRYGRDHEVIVRSDRGVEWGVVLSEATDSSREYMGESAPKGRILRSTSDEDRRSLEEHRERELSDFETCRQMIADMQMQMQLVDVEHIFGGERLVFYYHAEKRVDFRELVKSLAKEFKTRIEMRQIGVRDEARLLADYGDCGKPVCCNTHLQEMPPVSMKMAKVQKATLDPNKISGRCGRLKCCLRYEYDTYAEYQRELPRVGATVITQEGQGKVIGQEILSRKVMVLYEGGRRMLTGQSEIVTVVKRSGGGDESAKSRPAQKTEITPNPDLAPKSDPSKDE